MHGWIYILMLIDVISTACMHAMPCPYLELCVIHGFEGLRIFIFLTYHLKLIPVKLECLPLPRFILRFPPLPPKFNSLLVT